MDARVTDYTGNRHPGQIPTRITIIFSNGSGSPGGLPAWMAVSKERGDLKTHSAHAAAHVHTHTHTPGQSLYPALSSMVRFSRLVKISTHNSLAVWQMANGTSILTDSQREPTTKIPPKVKMLDRFDGWIFFFFYCPAQWNSRLCSTCQTRNKRTHEAPFCIPLFSFRIPMQKPVATLIAAVTTPKFHSCYLNISYSYIPWTQNVNKWGFTLVALRQIVNAINIFNNIK